MTVFFLDTSALVKRYVAEVGTAWVESLMGRGTTDLVYLAEITKVELVSAVARRVKGGVLPAPSAALALSQFRGEVGGAIRVMRMNGTHFDEAMILAEKHALRGYDAVQLAVARSVNAAFSVANVPVTLVSADLELNAAARAEGITVEDPNDHP